MESCEKHAKLQDLQQTSVDLIFSQYIFQRSSQLPVKGPETLQPAKLFPPRLPVSSNLRPRRHTWWIEAVQWYSFRAQCRNAQNSIPSPPQISSWSLLRSLKTASKGNSASVTPGSPAHFFFGTIDSTTAHETKNYSSKKISEPKHHGDLIKMWRLSFACCDYMMGLQCHQRHNCWWFSIHRKSMTYIIYIYNLMWIHQSSVITHDNQYFGGTCSNRAEGAGFAQPLVVHTWRPQPRPPRVSDIPKNHRWTLLPESPPRTSCWASAAREGQTSNWRPVASSAAALKAGRSCLGMCSRPKKAVTINKRSPSHHHKWAVSHHGSSSWHSPNPTWAAIEPTGTLGWPNWRCLLPLLLDTHRTFDDVNDQIHGESLHGNQRGDGGDGEIFDRHGQPPCFGHVWARKYSFLLIDDIRFPLSKSSKKCVAPISHSCWVSTRHQVYAVWWFTINYSRIILQCMICTQ